MDHDVDIASPLICGVYVAKHTPVAHCVHQQHTTPLQCQTSVLLTLPDPHSAVLGRLTLPMANMFPFVSAQTGWTLRYAYLDHHARARHGQHLPIPHAVLNVPSNQPNQAEDMELLSLCSIQPTSGLPATLSSMCVLSPLRGSGQPPAHLRQQGCMCLAACMHAEARAGVLLGRHGCGASLGASSP